LVSTVKQRYLNCLSREHSGSSLMSLHSFVVRYDEVTFVVKT
jgi:hypothetical protein